MTTPESAGPARASLVLVLAALLAGLVLVLLPLLAEDGLAVRTLQWRSQLAVLLLIPEGLVLVLVVAWLRLLRALVTRAGAGPGRWAALARRRAGTSPRRPWDPSRPRVAAGGVEQGGALPHLPRFAS